MIKSNINNNAQNMSKNRSRNVGPLEITLNPNIQDKIGKRGGGDILRYQSVLLYLTLSSINLGVFLIISVIAYLSGSDQIILLVNGFLLNFFDMKSELVEYLNVFTYFFLGINVYQPDNFFIFLLHFIITSIRDNFDSYTLLHATGGSGEQTFRTFTDTTWIFNLLGKIIILSNNNNELNILAVLYDTIMSQYLVKLINYSYLFYMSNLSTYINNIYGVADVKNLIELKIYRPLIIDRPFVHFFRYYNDFRDYIMWYVLDKYDAMAAIYRFNTKRRVRYTSPKILMYVVDFFAGSVTTILSILASPTTYYEMFLVFPPKLISYFIYTIVKRIYYIFYTTVGIRLNYVDLYVLNLIKVILPSKVYDIMAILFQEIFRGPHEFGISVIYAMRDLRHFITSHILLDVYKQYLMATVSKIYLMWCTCFAILQSTTYLYSKVSLFRNGEYSIVRSIILPFASSMMGGIDLETPYNNIDMKYFLKINAGLLIVFVFVVIPDLMVFLPKVMYSSFVLSINQIHGFLYNGNARLVFIEPIEYTFAAIKELATIIINILGIYKPTSLGQFFLILPISNNEIYQSAAYKLGCNFGAGFNEYILIKILILLQTYGHIDFFITIGSKEGKYFSFAGNDLYLILSILNNYLNGYILDFDMFGKYNEYLISIGYSLYYTGGQQFFSGIGYNAVYLSLYLDLIGVIIQGGKINNSSWFALIVTYEHIFLEGPNFLIEYKEYFMKYVNYMYKVMHDYNFLLPFYLIGTIEVFKDIIKVISLTMVSLITNYGMLYKDSGRFFIYFFNLLNHHNYTVEGNIINILSQFYNDRIAFLYYLISSVLGQTSNDHKFDEDSPILVAFETLFLGILSFTNADSKINGTFHRRFLSYFIYYIFFDKSSFFKIIDNAFNIRNGIEIMGFATVNILSKFPYSVTIYYHNLPRTLNDIIRILLEFAVYALDNSMVSKAKNAKLGNEELRISLERFTRVYSNKFLYPNVRSKKYEYEYFDEFLKKNYGGEKGLKAYNYLKNRYIGFLSRIHFVYYVSVVSTINLITPFKEFCVKTLEYFVPLIQYVMNIIQEGGIGKYFFEYTFEDLITSVMHMENLKSLKHDFIQDYYRKGGERYYIPTYYDSKGNNLLGIHELGEYQYLGHRRRVWFMQRRIDVWRVSKALDILGNFYELESKKKRRRYLGYFKKFRYMQIFEDRHLIPSFRYKVDFLSFWNPPYLNEPGFGLDKCDHIFL